MSGTADQTMEPNSLAMYVTGIRTLAGQVRSSMSVKQLKGYTDHTGVFSHGYASRELTHAVWMTTVTF